MSERLPPGITTRVFVGRENELTQLRAGLDRALKGNGGMFLLDGEAGIGKTRVAEELGLEARRRGAAVFLGQSTQAEGAPPYWPWVQILRSLLRDLGNIEFSRVAGSRLAQVLQVVPQLRDHFPDIPPILIDDEGEARFGIYDSVTQLLLDTTTRRPMVLVLDDLHWADTPSVLLLQLLVSGLPQSRLLVIGTYRDRELPASHPFRTQLVNFLRQGESTHISIRGLEDTHVRVLLRALTGFQPVEDKVQRVQAQTGGNPFFLTELARTFGDEGEEPSEWTSHAGPGEAVPESIGVVLRRRLQDLSADCRSVLEVASVTGQEFQLDLLEAATETPRPRLLDLLDEAIANAVVTRRDGSYAFIHGLVRDTIYGGISTAHRGDLHGLVGRVLEQRLFSPTDLQVAQLAYHFVEAAVTDKSLRAKAIEYVAESSKRALAELAYEEAVRLIESGLGKAAPIDPAKRAELLLALGRAKYMAGDVGGAMSAALELAQLAEKLDDRVLLARAALVVRGVGGRGLSNEIKRLCEVALRRPPQNKGLMVELLSQLTVALMQTGDIQDERGAIESSQQALQLAEIPPYI